MDDLIQILLDKMGVSGALIVALAGYLLKKEIYFQKERSEFMTILDNKSKEMLSIFDRSMTSNHALEKEIHALRIELGREGRPPDGYD